MLNSHICQSENEKMEYLKLWTFGVSIFIEAMNGIHHECFNYTNKINTLNQETATQYRYAWSIPSFNSLPTSGRELKFGPTKMKLKENKSDMLSEIKLQALKKKLLYSNIIFIKLESSKILLN